MHFCLIASLIDWLKDVSVALQCMFLQLCVCNTGFFTSNSMLILIVLYFIGTKCYILNTVDYMLAS